jgi:uncharacterized protein YdcH (DUF465 family)
MPLYKSAQTIEVSTDSTQDPHSFVESSGDTIHAEPNEVIVYNELPEKDDVIQMHDEESPDDGCIEITFELPHVPGAPDALPFDVVMDDEEDKDEDELVVEKHDPWNWKMKGLKNFLGWLEERLEKIPKHSGKDSAGIERAIHYLKKVDDEISKAMREDYDEEIDSLKAEDARNKINDGVDRLEERLDSIRSSRKKSKRASAEGIVKSAGTPIFSGVVVTVPMILSRIARTCINGAVSNGKDIEHTFHNQVKLYDLTKREQAEVLQLLSDMGYYLGPQHDRGENIGEKADPTSSDRPELSAQYQA